MYENGIHVLIADEGGVPMAEHPNRFLKLHDPYPGYVFSSLVSAEPETPASIHLTIDGNFPFYQAGGVAVLLSQGKSGAMDHEFTQLFWIDKANAGKELSIYATSEFHQNRTSKRGVKMPDRSGITNARTARTSWDAKSNARDDSNTGCITAFVCRGKLSNRTGRMSPRQSNEPTWEKYEKMPGPKVIRHDWFTPLGGELGKPIAFQFKNMSLEDIRGLPARDLPNRGPVFSERSRRPYSSTKRPREESPEPTKKRARQDRPRSSKYTSSSTNAKSKGKTAYVEDADDDEDDEENLPAIFRYHFQPHEVKQEDDSEVTHEANRANPNYAERFQRAGVHSPPPTPPGLSQEDIPRMRDDTDNTTGRSQQSSDVGVDADEELLRLQIEENRLLLEGNRLEQLRRRSVLQRRANGKDH